MTLTMQRVCEILDACGSRGEPGPLGVMLPNCCGDGFRKGSRDPHRLECGSGIAGRSNKWRLVNVRTGEATKATSSERGIRSLVAQYWRSSKAIDYASSDEGDVK